MQVHTHKYTYIFSSSLYELLSYFTIVDNATMNMEMQIWDSDYISLDMYPEVGLLNHKIVLFFFFGKNLYVICRNCCAYLQLPSTVYNSSSLYSIVYSELVISCLFDNSHYYTHEVIAYCVFHLYLPDNLWCSHIPVDYCYVFLEEMPIQFLYPF